MAEEEDGGDDSTGAMVVENEHDEIHLTDKEDKDPALHCLMYNYRSSWSNSISWSIDGRVAVLTDNCIYVLTLMNSNKRKKFGISLGLKFETMFIPNLKSVKYDVGISIKGFHKAKFEDRASYVFDRASVQKEELLANVDSYRSLKWSPLGSTKDGRCHLATLGVDGVVRLQFPQKMTAVWDLNINITDYLYKFLFERDWYNEHLESKGDENEPARESDLNTSESNLCSEYSKRKHMLQTTVICWCPVSWYCHKCCLNSHPDNVYYTSYFQTYVRCNHSKLFLLTATQSGHLYIWLTTLNVNDKTLIEVELLLHWKADLSWPTSLSWHQSTSSDAFVAVGFANGCIAVYQIIISVQNGQYSCKYIHSLDIWKEEDMLNASFLEWILPKDTVLRLIATKGTDIVLFKTAKQTDGLLVCLSCEIAPSCHTSPITSLHCVRNKYVLTSSDTATQYFDIDNETLPFCDNSVLRGFKCMGISADANMTMFGRVSCANRLLLHQVAFIKQTEISFLPFISPEMIAEHLINGTVSLDMSVREYFSVSAAADFLLPDSLHKYCDEPDTYEQSIKELQLYLYFNQLRYMRQTGLRETSITHEEVKANLVSTQFDDPVIRKIERQIDVMFFAEMLSKCVQLLESGWLKLTPHGSLTLLLIADWLVQADMSPGGLDVPIKCFTLLQDCASVHEVEILQEAAMNLKQKDRGCIKTVEKVNDIASTEKCNTVYDISDSTQKCDTVNDISESTEKCDAVTVDEKNISHRETPVPKRHWRACREKCPYCGCEVSLNSLGTGVCSNGHSYSRCCLTLRISMETTYRTCLGCARNISHKNCNSELDVDSVLLNIDHCPFCGCCFVDPADR